MSSFRRTLARPVTASTTVAVGQVVTISTAEFIPLLGPTDQPGTAAVKPAGIALTSAVDGTECTVCYDDECDGLFGANVAVGDELVAEYETGRLIPYVAATYVEGTEIWIVARALEGGVDGQNARVSVEIRSKTIPTAPAE